jgi:hypothetical protein
MSKQLEQVANYDSGDDIDVPDEFSDDSFEEGRVLWALDMK